MIIGKEIEREGNVTLPTNRPPNTISYKEEP